MTVLKASKLMRSIFLFALLVCWFAGSEGFEEWVATLNGYLADITNSLPSGILSGDLVSEPKVG